MTMAATLQANRMGFMGMSVHHFAVPATTRFMAEPVMMLPTVGQEQTSVSMLKDAAVVK